MLRLTVGAKFAGVMLLAILLVLLAGATGIAELRQLDQQVVRLAANAEEGEYAHILQLELRDLRALLAEGINRKNVEWFHQPVRAASKSP